MMGEGWRWWLNGHFSQVAAALLYVKMGWNEKLLERKEKYIFTLWARGDNYSDEKYIGETEHIA